jgi:adenylate cyclase
VERKLTAILCADVYGYSRLMGEDEEATHRTLTSHRKIIDSLIEQHHGRFVNSAGDSVLAEFASVVNAVQCAVDIQTTLKAENASLPPERRMEFRIGVNSGDVIVDGEQIYGDGVNVAARLESLAEPGGICISGTAHDQLGNKLALGYEDLGEQAVKNIAKPVRVLRVMLEGGAASRSTAKATERSLRKHWRGGVFSLVGLAIIVGTIVLVQHLSLRPPTTTASIPPAQKLAPPLPDMPSIAVLPLTNMSGDREQEYFSDGITDDLITALSRLPGLFVIARNSSFTYKGKAVGLQDVGKELGVKYVLEGGVRKAGDQVRITVQLADATTGEELWAERYDRPLRGIFALQDEIVRRIVTTLNLQLTLAERGVLIPRETDDLEAYDDVLRGVEYRLSETKDGNAKARQMFEKAIQLDPKYARAHAALGVNYLLGWAHLLSPDPNGLERAFQLAQQAIALDDSLAPAHGLLAGIYVHNGQYDQAVTEAERSIALNPNSPIGYVWLAEVMNNTARPAEALVAAEKAMRLDPRNRDNYLAEQGWAYTHLGRYQEAIPALKRDMALTNNLWDHVFLVRDYTELGQEDAARADAAEVERRVALNPNSPLGDLALAVVMNYTAEPAQALVAVQKAMRLDPGNPERYLLVEGFAYQGLGRYEDSITAYKGFLALHPDIFWAHLGLAVDDIELGHDDAARAEAAEVLKLNPQYSLETMLPTVGPKGKVLAENARWSADLRKAGLK